MTLRTKERIKGWLGLATGVGTVLLFIFVLAPACKAIPEVKRYTDYVALTGIEAGALWWSEVEVTADAEIGARTTFEHTPRLTEAEKQ